LGEVTWDKSKRVLLKEFLVGLANGLVNGVVAAIVVVVWFGLSPRVLWIGSIIAAAMVINLVIAGIAGTLIPLAIKRLNADPALASTVFVTTCTDVGGFFAFLGLAAVAIKYLS